MSKVFEKIFGSKQEKYIFLGLAVVIIIVAGITFFPVIKAQIDEKINGTEDY